MKCIHCGRDSKYPDRTNRKCPGCQRPFAFEPRQGDKVTDTAFLNAIQAVSSNGALRWGVENLYYEMCRRKRSKPIPWLAMVILLVACFVTAGLAATKHQGWFVATVLTFAGFVTGCIQRTWPRKFVSLERTEFSLMWDQWCKAHGKPEGVIERQPKPATHVPLEADIGDYSFDRAVICDRARTVDLLVANNFHFENNCAILSVEGYPQGPFETIRAMLKRNPKLEVFTLHDATVKGCTLAHHLRTSKKWFAESTVKVVDIGLRPVHAPPFLGLFQESKDRVFPEGEGLTAQECDWLSTYTLELAVIKPEQVLKRLYRAINKQPSNAKAAADGDTGFIFVASGGDGDSSGGFFLDNDSFGTEAGDVDGGADSFG